MYRHCSLLKKLPKIPRLLIISYWFTTFLFKVVKNNNRPLFCLGFLIPSQKRNSAKKTKRLISKKKEKAIHYAQTHQSSVLHGSPAHHSAASAFSAREINGPSPSLSLHLLRRRRSLRVLCVLRVSNLKSRTGISSHPAGSHFLNPLPKKHAPHPQKTL